MTQAGGITEAQTANGSRAGLTTGADWEALCFGLMASVDDGIVIADETGTIRACNQALETLFGYPPGHLVGKKINALMPAYEAAHHDDYLRSYLATRQSQFVGLGPREMVAQRMDGTPIVINIAVNAVPNGSSLMFVAALREQKDELSGADLNYVSEHDALTGLFNYHYFKGELERVVERATRGQGEPCALLYLDIDGFAKVNEQFGHGEGDNVLTEFANALRKRCRKSDLAARLYADKFAVLLYGIADEHLANVGESFRSVGDTLTAGNGALSLHASAGLLTLSRHITCIENAESCAERACDKAKSQGGKRTEIFSE